MVFKLVSPPTRELDIPAGWGERGENTRRMPAKYGYHSSYLPSHTPPLVCLGGLGRGVGYRGKCFVPPDG